MDNHLIFLQNIYTSMIDKNLSISNLKLLINHLLENIQDYEPNHHPLGFVHCKIANIKDSTIRLHIWNNNNINRQEHSIHDHIFSLRSYLITGCIENKTYNLTINDSKTFSANTRQKFKVEYNQFHSTLKPSNEFVDISLREINIFHKNEYYDVTIGDFHESNIIDNTFTATLVLTSSHAEASPILLGDPNKHTDIINIKTPYQRDNWRKELEQLLLDI